MSRVGGIPAIHGGEGRQCRDSRVAVVREFQAFGDGQPLPGDAGRHVGTALSPDMAPFARRGTRVWHVFERRTSGGDVR